MLWRPLGAIGEERLDYQPEDQARIGFGDEEYAVIRYGRSVRGVALALGLGIIIPFVIRYDASTVCLALDEAENARAWDVISLSLVLNFVPDLRDRG